MKNDIASVLITIPTVRGISPRAFMSFISMERFVAHTGAKAEIDYKVFSDDSLLPRVRNSAVSLFLDGDYDYLMTVDDDIDFPPEALFTLVSADKDIICGIYPMRSPQFPIYSVRLILNKKGSNEFFINIEGGHLIELEYASTGFLLVRRNVVEAMVSAYAEEYYRENLSERFGRKTYNLYNPMIVTRNKGAREYLSEDWAFCERARRLGFRIWGETNIALGHSGGVSIDGKRGNELIEALIKQAKDPKAVPK